jgi:single-strand DNA-binding protein
VPVAVFEATTEFRADDQIVVLGYVRRRFFRAGGVTQSRTEVVATKIVKASRGRDVTRLVAVAIRQLEAAA